EEGPLRRALMETDDRAPVERVLRLLRDVFGPENVFVEIQRSLRRDERRINELLVQLARAKGLPLLASNGVLYATPSGRQVLDVFTCLRHHTHLDLAGRLLTPNTERHMKEETELQTLFADLPEAIHNTGRLAERLEFSLSDLGYEFPRYPVHAGETMESTL